MREVKLYYDDEADTNDYSWCARVEIREGQYEEGFGHTPVQAFEDLRFVLGIEG